MWSNFPFTVCSGLPRWRVRWSANARSSAVAGGGRFSTRQAGTLVHNLVHAAERIHRRTCICYGAQPALASSRVLTREAVYAFKRRLFRFVKLSLCAIDAKAPDPLQIYICAAILNGAASAPHAKHVFGARR